MTDCDRCGSDYRVEVCVVHEDDRRGRVEAHLCYGCRRDTPHDQLTG